MQTLQHNCDESYLSQPSKGCVKSFSKVPVNNGGEDLSHSVVIKRVDGYDTHVPSESIWDVITSSTWGTHGRNEELNETRKQEMSIYLVWYKVLREQRLAILEWCSWPLHQNTEVEQWPELDQNKVSFTAKLAYTTCRSPAIKQLKKS